MEEYKVTWTIETSANSYEEAVIEAVKMWPFAGGKIVSTATVFAVEEMVTGEGMAIDIAEQMVGDEPNVTQIVRCHYKDDPDVIRDLWYVEIGEAIVTEYSASFNAAKAAIMRHPEYREAPIQSWFVLGLAGTRTLMIEHVRYIVP